MRSWTICLTALVAALLAWHVPGVSGATAVGKYGPPVRLAYLQDELITESSGIAASRRRHDLFWTHNDSGDEPLLYAFDRHGRALGTFAVTGATAIDWEDIAAGPGPAGPSLYIGDIGDNGRRRDDCVVYRVPEPRVSTTRASDIAETAAAERFPFRFPDGRRNAETLMVHPRSGEVYIVTKGEDPPVVYRFPRPLRRDQRVTLERVATLGGIFAHLTGGDIAPDGRRLVVRDYLLAYEYFLPVGRPFTAIFRAKPVRIRLANERQGEAITYRSDGCALLTTSEGRPTPLHELLRLTR